MRQLSLLTTILEGSHVHGHHGPGGLKQQLQPMEGGLVGRGDAALTAGLGVAIAPQLGVRPSRKLWA